MSRCVSCNCILTTQEMSSKGVYSGKYLDLCRRCTYDAEIDFEVDSSLPDNDAPQEFEGDTDEYNDKDYEV